MADHFSSDLPYGHCANALYDPDEQEWRFRRLPLRQRIVKQFDEDTATGEPRSNDGDQHNQTGSAAIERELKAVVRSHPDLQSAKSLLPSLLQTSAAVEDAAARHDSGKGSLLAFGQVFDETVRRTVQVVAHASGPSGSDLRVVRVQLQRQGWDDSRDIWLEMPVLKSDEGLWRGTGAPIQQVTFAQPRDGGESLLAVRMLDRTLIFRLVLRKAGTVRLSFTIVLDLPFSQTGSVPHTDAHFNPWFTKQFAVALTNGAWGVWEFESGRLTRVKRIHEVDGATNSMGKTSTIDHGWRRLVWIYGPTQLLVCSRRQTTLFDLSTTPASEQAVDVGLDDAFGWVLDAALISSRPDYACILTNTHVVLVRVGEDDQGQPSATTILRLKHFRSPEDRSLRLLLMTRENDVLITVRSHVNSLIECYNINFGSSGVLSYSDPTQLAVVSDQTRGRSLDMCIRPIVYREYRRSGGRHSFAHQLQDANVDFYLVTDLDKSFSLRGRLLCTHNGSQIAPVPKPPTWETGRGVTSRGLVNDRFVVEDNSLGDPDEKSGAPASAPALHRANADTRTRDMAWTVDYQRVCRILETSRVQENEDIRDILEEARHIMTESDVEGRPPMQTLFELATGEILMKDVDLAASRLGQIEQVQTTKRPKGEFEAGDGMEARPEVTLGRVCIPERVEFATREASTAMTVYDSLVSEWISSLPNTVPGRIRLSREQLARSIAAQVTLSSRVLRAEPAQETLDSQQKTQPEDEEKRWEMPFRGPALSQASQGSVLPTPSPSATPSINTGTLASFTAHEVSRLNKYTSFTKPAPSALPRSLKGILAHWTVGEDPATYDWLNTSRQVARHTEKEDAESQLTEKERARLQRKAERLIHRQRREAAASQQQHMASSQLPQLLVSASQPVVPKTETQPTALSQGGAMASSQSFALGAASQAVAGRFGGRPPAKKKRKQGF